MSRGLVPHPIPYQGSKRNIAWAILKCFPKKVRRLVEPFAGSAAVSLAAAYHRRASSFLINDANAALMQLWQAIIEEPEVISKKYRKIWHDQDGREREYYDLIRDQFNKDQRPDHFLYLLTRCVKASVRYNSNGEFNQSPDNRRRGANPDTIKGHIVGASGLLQGKSEVRSSDYAAILAETEKTDLVYMDPPYQGTSTGRDQRYIYGVAFETFVEQLDMLNRRSISFILSYDGRTGERTYGKNLPEELNLTRLEIDAGRSSQATLLGQDSRTYEALFLSPALVAQIGQQFETLITPDKQLKAFLPELKDNPLSAAHLSQIKGFSATSYNRRTAKK